MFRRALLIYLDPHAPWWASGMLWAFLAILGWVVWESSGPVPSETAPRMVVAAGPPIVFLTVFVLALVAIFLRREQELWYRKQLLRRGAGLCPQCGYPLKGLPTERCPECGVNIRKVAEEAARMTRLDSRL